MSADLRLPQGSYTLHSFKHLVRPFEEDGRDFIKAATCRVWDDPFPELAPKISKSQAKKEKRALVSGEDRDPMLSSALETVPVPHPKLRNRISHFVMNSQPVVRFGSALK